MGYTIKVNPVDLQDRDAFLAFLGRQAEKGYQAFRVLPTHTYFRKAPSESTCYALTFDGEKAEGGGNLFGMNNGIAIYPAAATSVDPGWCEKVLANYDRFTLFRRARLLGYVLQLFPTVILLVPCIYLLDLFGPASQFTEFTDMIQAMVAVLGGIGIFQVMQLAIHLFSGHVDALHRKGMQMAVDLGQLYRTPETLAAKVRVKNGLSCYCYGLVLTVELLYLLLVLYLLCR